MSRYIDIEPYEIDGWYLQKTYSTTYGAGVKTMPLKSVPTADAAPIKHGRWIEDSEGWWHCSVCGRGIPPKLKQDLNEFNKWCGRCGARMDGGEND